MEKLANKSKQQINYNPRQMKEIHDTAATKTTWMAWIGHFWFDTKPASTVNILMKREKKHSDEHKLICIWLKANIWRFWAWVSPHSLYTHIHLLRIFVEMFCLFFLPLFKVNSDFSLSNWLYIHIYINYIFAINYAFCSKFQMNFLVGRWRRRTSTTKLVEHWVRAAYSCAFYFTVLGKIGCCDSVDSVKVSVSSRATNNQLNKESV